MVRNGHFINDSDYTSTWVLPARWIYEFQ
jgi:hypothetical protein